MGLVPLLVAFVAFVLLVGAVHLINDQAAERYRYEPFSLPNAALMLIGNGLLLGLLSGLTQGRGPWTVLVEGGAVAWGLLGFGLVLVGGMYWLIASRTDRWLGLVAVAILLVGAPVVFFTVLYRLLAGGEPDQP